MSYALIGYVLANVELENWKRYIIYIIGIVGLFVHIYGTQILSFAEGKIVQTFKGYNNVQCILYSIAIFLFFKKNSHILMANSIVKNFVMLINKYSFCIYLLHWFVIKMLLYIFPIDTRSIVYRIGSPWIIIPVCIVISFLLRKIPFVKAIVPSK